MLRTSDARKVLAEAERGLAHFGPDRPEHWRFRALTANALLYLDEFSRRRELLKPKVPKSLQGTPQVAAYESSQGQPPPKATAAAMELLNRKGVIPEAQYRQQAQAARASGDTRLETYLVINYGQRLIDEFRMDEASAILRELRDRYPQDRFAAGFAAVNLGYAHQLLGQQDAALREFEAAESHFRALSYLSEQRRALRNIGSIHFARGEHSEAQRYFVAAKSLIKPESNAESVAGLMSDLAANALAAGDRAAAAEALARAESDPVHRTIFEYPWIRLSRGRLCELEGGDALTIYREVAGSKPLDRTAPLEARVRIAGLLRRSGRHDGAEAEYKAALIEAQRLRRVLKREESKIGFATTVMRIYQGYVELLVDQGREAEALSVADSSRMQVLGEDSGTAKLDLARIKAILAQSNSAAVFYWIAPRRSFVWIVDGKGARRGPDLAGSAEIRAWTDQFMQAVRDRKYAKGSSYAPPQKLWKELVEKPGIGSLDRLILVPDDSLHWLNFEALPVGNSGQFWIERASIQVAPSLRILGTAKGRLRSPPGRLLMIGDAQPTPEHGKLRHVSKELDRIAAIHVAAGHKDPVRIDGVRATPQAFAAARPNLFGTIHFAAHAVANPQSPLDSAVILTPPAHGSSRLYARDIMNLRIQADLVTLSACSAAGSAVYGGEGLVGFSWAFLKAGARKVVAGLWQVDDESTGELMVKFYEEMVAGKKAPAAALRDAKLALLRNQYAKPYYWAPFQMFTSGTGEE